MACVSRRFLPVRLKILKRFGAGRRDFGIHSFASPAPFRAAMVGWGVDLMSFDVCESQLGISLAVTTYQAGKLVVTSRSQRSPASPVASTRTLIHNDRLAKRDRNEGQTRSH